MVNIHAKKWLASERAEDYRDYSGDNIRGYNFIDTCGHGYLVLGSEDNGYSNALEIARLSPFSYIINTLVYLEEDSDMQKFLELGLNN